MRKISKIMLGVIALSCVSLIVLFEGCSKKEDDSSSYPNYPALDNTKLANKIWGIKTEPKIVVNVNYPLYEKDIERVQDTLGELFNTGLNYKFKAGKLEVWKFVDTSGVYIIDTVFKIPNGNGATRDSAVHKEIPYDTTVFVKGGELPYKLRADQRIVLGDLIYYWAGMKSDDEVVLVAQMSEIRELVRAVLKIQTDYTDELIDNTILRFITGEANIVLNKIDTKEKW